MMCAFASGAEPGTLPESLGDRFTEIKSLAPEGFAVLTEPPFVVAGNESAETVHAHATGTIRFAVKKLKQDFFAREPDGTIAIWLFKDRRTYEEDSRALYSESHYSPFGFYSARHQVLLMNIATGKGTLVHEIVHPFMRANFPACPPWFDEGLAALFEAYSERDGHMVGLVNWRLPGLQEQIRARRTLAFAALFALDEDHFYGAAEGYNYYYAEARYLCYYLQEHGRLVQFYREFVAHAHEDPTGLNSLRTVLSRDDLAAFQLEWEQFVLQLKMPATLR